MLLKSTVALLLVLVSTQAAQLHLFKNYYAAGSISLPYAEIKEPFEAWYSASKNKSRIDYYDGMVKNVIDASTGVTYKIAPMTNEKVLNKKTCFKTVVGEGDSVAPQSIIPDTSLFTADGTEMVHGLLCNKWIYKNTPNNTHLDQVYTLYVYGNALPVKFVMMGYNIISGSHVDKYIIDYTAFQLGDDISDAIFQPYNALECGGFPGPGHAGQQEDPFSELVSGVHDHDKNFEKFGDKYNKVYSSKDEHIERLAAYTNNMRYIASMNRKGLSYKVGPNHMTDWYPHEHSRMRGKLYSGVPNRGKPFNADEMKRKELPKNLDLRISGAIGAVKDQASCGSCWSFATTGSIEGAFFNKNKYRVSLSEQNLMDCTWGFGNNACDGGEEWRAYEWIMKHEGIMYEADYGQYLMADGMCHYNKSARLVLIDSYVNVTSENETALKLALFNMGAVAVNIDASHKSLRFYQSGVYYEPECKKGPEDLDHAVLAVGYGTLGEKDYWIVKNSWSTHWGDVGYVLMSRKDNNCGVTTDSTYVIVK